eukprot:6212829-Pleurochrysis_carterae.AAC.1
MDREKGLTYTYATHRFLRSRPVDGLHACIAHRSRYGDRPEMFYRVSLVRGGRASQRSGSGASPSRPAARQHARPTSTADGVVSQTSGELPLTFNAKQILAIEERLACVWEAVLARSEEEATQRISGAVAAAQVMSQQPQHDNFCCDAWQVMSQKPQGCLQSPFAGSWWRIPSKWSRQRKSPIRYGSCSPSCSAGAMLRTLRDKIVHAACSRFWLRIPVLEGGSLASLFIALTWLPCKQEWATQEAQRIEQLKTALQQAAARERIAEVNVSELSEVQLAFVVYVIFR